MEVLNAFVLNGTTHNVRTTTAANGETVFLASDIASAIEHHNIRKLLKNVDEDEKVVAQSYTLGGSQSCTFLTEDGVYEILFLSKLPAAKPFKKWVKNVIKTIRKTGKYELELKLKEHEEESSARIQEALAISAA